MRRLRDRMHEDLTLRGLSAKTIDSYLRCVRKFAEHFGRSPSTLGAEPLFATKRCPKPSTLAASTSPVTK